VRSEKKFSFVAEAVKDRSEFSLEGRGPMKERLKTGRRKTQEWRAGAERGGDIEH
jgi:hypothetical protein